MSLSRDAAVARLRQLVETVETDRLPVPVRAVWVYGDAALGLDPVDRLGVYLTKDLLFKDAPDREPEFAERLGVDGVGKTVSAAWADEHPDRVRADDDGHAAPERCLAAQLFDEDDPVHLEVSNAGFEDEVGRRVEAARAHEEYTRLLDPRAACLWVDDGDGGTTSETAFRKLADGTFVFPTLSMALESLGMDETEAEIAAEELRARRRGREGLTVRGDVV